MTKSVKSMTKADWAVFARKHGLDPERVWRTMVAHKVAASDRRFPDEIECRKALESIRGD